MNSPDKSDLIEINEENFERLKNLDEIHETIFRVALGDEAYEAFMKEMQPFLEKRARQLINDRQLLRKRLKEIFDEDDAQIRH